MMTSFVAAIDDGIAYESSIKRRQANQKSTGHGVEVSAGTPAPNLFSIFNLNLKGNIEKKNNIEDSEEIELAKKHTEASLFMYLRGILHDYQLIKTIENTESFANIEHGSLIEVTGQILRSPLSTHLNTIFQLFEFFGVELPDNSKQAPPQTSTTTNPQRQKGVQQTQKQQATPDFITQIERLSKFGENDKTTQSTFIIKLLQRIREDLEHAKVKDVLMEPINMNQLSILIALSSEFLLPGSLENMLSGQFTVLGKVARKLVGEETINLYERSPSASFFNSQQQLKNAIIQMSAIAPSTKASGADIVKAPGLQIIPLAIFI